MLAPFARQAIYNRKEEIIGYELLYRSSIMNKAPAVNGDRATMELLNRLLQTGGIEQAADGKLAFVNFQGHLFAKAETLSLRVPRALCSLRASGGRRATARPK